MRQIIGLVFLFSLTSVFAGEQKQAYEDYCIESGGHVETMAVQFDTHSGRVQGNSKSFCNFWIDGGFIAVGLSTFSSSSPSIAATLIKNMPVIAPGSPLLKGNYSNPSANVCKNLGGSSVGFLVMSGGFANALGQNDICVFGDGSMVSGWSLIYIANNRSGYHSVREKIKAQPLDIDIPG